MSNTLRNFQVVINLRGYSTAEDVERRVRECVTTHPTASLLIDSCSVTDDAETSDAIHVDDLSEEDISEFKKARNDENESRVVQTFMASR